MNYLTKRNVNFFDFKQNKQMIDPKGIGTVYSSNDSGFSNEPPPQPDVDYSDEDCVPRIPIR